MHLSFISVCYKVVQLITNSIKSTIQELEIKELKGQTVNTGEDIGETTCSNGCMQELRIFWHDCNVGGIAVLIFWGDRA